jgi:hypothetical protein
LRFKRYFKEAQALPVPLEDRKKTRFFVFTDWQPGKHQASTGLDHWIPFHGGSDEILELCEIKKQVNVNIDRRLAGHVLDDNRIYFSHLNTGVEWIEGGSPDWRYMQGAIVESEAASTQRGHADALDRLANGLALNAPSYLRSKLKVLVCLLPAKGLRVQERFKPLATFRIKHTANAQELIDKVSDWLTEANQQIDDDRKGFDVDVVTQVDELLNRLLG